MKINKKDYGYYKVQKESLEKRGYELEKENEEWGIFVKKEKKQESGKKPNQG